MSLMILVAFSAVAVWSVKEATEAYHFRALKGRYLKKAKVEGIQRKGMERIVNQHSGNPSNIPDVDAWCADYIRYHGDLERKYLKAAENPHVALPPDPPKPPLIRSGLEKLKRELEVLEKKLFRIREAREKQQAGLKKELEKQEANPNSERSRTAEVPDGLASPSSVVNEH